MTFQFSSALLSRLGRFSPTLTFASTFSPSLHSPRAPSQPRRSDRGESIGIAFAPSKIIFRKVVPLGNVNTPKVGLPTSKEIWESNRPVGRPTLRTGLIFQSAPLLSITVFPGFISFSGVDRASLTTLNPDTARAQGISRKRRGEREKVTRES